MATKEVVGLDVAQEEFNRFIESMDLEWDPEAHGEEEQKKLEKIRKLVLKAITTGQITIDERGVPTLHLRFPPPPGTLTTITIERPKGNVIIGAQGKNSTPSTIISDLTGQPAAIFSKLDLKADYQVLDALASLFLV